MTLRQLPVAIIGGGPVGLAAAAHLTERNIPFILFESGATVGANLMDWKHVRVFSPWRYNIDKAAERLLLAVGWKKPDEDGLPTGREIVKQYLQPLASHPRLQPYIYLKSKVFAISRKGIGKVRTEGRDKVPFVLKVDNDGITRMFEAFAIVDASGTWQQPNPIGSGGIFAAGEEKYRDRITYRIPDILGEEKQYYAGKSVLVIGGGHSAVNSLLSLGELKKDYPETEIHWSLLSADLAKVYGGKEEDALEARGALGISIENLVRSGQIKIHAPFQIHHLTPAGERINVGGYIADHVHTIANVDLIIANTGARPDISIFRELRVQTDPALECVPELATLIDPNIHSCGTVRPHGELQLRQPEPNFYVAGVKSYGRAPTFLMATGYEQVRSIAAYMDGDIEAAERVELDLPETGVCSATPGGKNDEGGCCGVAPSKPKQEEATAACCSTSHNSNSTNMETKNKHQVPTSTGCCGGAPVANEDACCVLDEQKKAEGEEGCGCNAPSTVKETAAAGCC